MAWGAILGSLIGAGGQVAGGLTGQATGGDPRTTSYNPNLDLALQASQFDALNPLGFADINNVPGPYQQLVNKLISGTMPSKTRHQIVSVLNNIRANPDELNDPFGKNYTRDQLKEFLNSPDGAPNGRMFENKALLKYGIASHKGAEQVKLPLEDIGKLNRVLKASGMTLDDLKTVFSREAEYKDQLERLNAAGLGRMNEDTIISRARAAANASQLIGDASTFSQTGEASGTVANVLDRDNRKMKDLQDRIGLLTNFGGISGAAGVKALTDADLDQNLRVLEQSLGISSAISGALAPGLAGAANSASGGSAASLNAAQIAAQQAQAANQLRQSAGLNSGSSLGNAIGAASSAIGSGLSNASYLSQLNRMPTSSSASFVDPFSSGSSSYNGIGAFASGGGQLAPIGGWK